MTSETATDSTDQEAALRPPVGGGGGRDEKGHVIDALRLGRHLVSKSGGGGGKGSGRSEFREAASPVAIPGPNEDAIKSLIGLGSELWPCREDRHKHTQTF